MLGRTVPSRFSTSTRLRRTCGAAIAWSLVCATALASPTDPTTRDARPDEPLPTVRIGDEEIESEFADEETDEPSSFPDPLEPLNRGTLAFNQIVDDVLLNPITDLYQLVLPHPVRKSVRNFLDNLDSPAVLANDLLQREWNDARVTVTRFGINSSLGVAGILDPAASFGWEGHYSDFGQTMALEGVPSGPYVVIPILGPTTVRDGCGEIVDVLFRPVTFILGPAAQIFYTTIYGGSSGLATRDVHAAELQMLEESSVDFYAALRNAYFQSRTAEIWSRRTSHDSLSELASESLWGGESAERRAAAY